MLENEGISVTVADARFAKPFDTQLLKNLVSEHQALFVVEEGVQGGFGSLIATWLANQGLLDKVKIRFLSIPDLFIEQASMKRQYEIVSMDAKGIADAVKAMVKS